MGDRTTYQLYVYACPPEQRQGVVDVINEYGLGPEWGLYTDHALEVAEFELGHVYCDDEMSVGQTEEIARRLIEVAPGSIFEIWEDPKYEWLGSLVMYTPELGRFDAECDASGNAVVDPTHLLDSLPDEMPVREVRALLQRLGGKPWKDAIYPLQTRYVEGERSG